LIFEYSCDICYNRFLVNIIHQKPMIELAKPATN
jgi:hypothetical protein